MDEIEQRFRSTLERQLAWLKCDALPRWATDGVDPMGGFFERIDQTGEIVPDLPRRARVVARQTYVFALASERGWGDYWALADHGAAEIGARCLLENGLSLTTYASDGKPLNTQFDGYDQAFVLFALANIAQIQSEKRTDSLLAGERLLTAMREGFRHPEIGFEEAMPRQTPLLQNPHMHLLEACLAFDEVPGASPIWREQAGELVELALTRLVHKTKGGIHEFFDGNWLPSIDEQGGWVEPGHQFEWAWLLWRWSDRVGDYRAQAMAYSLYRIGCEHGRAPSGHIIDALTADFAPRSTALRLWPQTERLKACVEYAKRTQGAERASALLSAIEALDSLDAYFDTPLPGLWYDRLTSDRKVVEDAAPASSLYHIVCALDCAEQYSLIGSAGEKHD